MLPHTIVFIPGLLLTERLFSAQEDALRAYPNITVIHANTLGHDSIKSMAEEILDRQDGFFVPVGLSLGGCVVNELAKIAPDRLEGIALLSTNARKDNEARKRVRRELVLMSTKGKFKGVTPRLLPRFLSSEALKDEMLTSAVMEMAEQVGPHNFALQQDALMGRHAHLDTLSDFHKPSLVLCGDLDDLTPPEWSQEMAAVLSDVECVILPGVGHLSSMEAPDAVSAGLLRLLKRIDATR